MTRPPEERTQDDHGNGDLADRMAIEEMVRRFYAAVAQDDLLGPVFVDVARVDWSEHLPKLVDFWCRVLLSEPGYEGNPLRAHHRVHAEQPFTDAMFERWLDLFETTVEAWHGAHADDAVAFARRVAHAHRLHLRRGDPTAAAVQYSSHTPRSGT